MIQREPTLLAAITRSVTVFTNLPTADLTRFQRLAHVKDRRSNELCSSANLGRISGTVVALEPTAPDRSHRSGGRLVRSVGETFPPTYRTASPVREVRGGRGRYLPRTFRPR